MKSEPGSNRVDDRITALGYLPDNIQETGVDILTRNLSLERVMLKCKISNFT